MSARVGIDVLLRQAEVDDMNEMLLLRRRTADQEILRFNTTRTGIVCIVFHSEGMLLSVDQIFRMHVFHTSDLDE